MQVYRIKNEDVAFSFLFDIYTHAKIRVYKYKSISGYVLSYSLIYTYIWELFFVVVKGKIPR